MKGAKISKEKFEEWEQRQRTNTSIQQVNAKLEHFNSHRVTAKNGGKGGLCNNWYWIECTPMGVQGVLNSNSCYNGKSILDGLQTSRSTFKISSRRKHGRKSSWPLGGQRFLKQGTKCTNHEWKTRSLEVHWNEQLRLNHHKNKMPVKGDSNRVGEQICNRHIWQKAQMQNI